MGESENTMQETTIFNRNMPKISSVRYDARTLSSGTIASLIGESDYTLIEGIQNDFIAYCDKMDGIFKTWQAAWTVFAMSTRTNRSHVTAYRLQGYNRKVSPWFPTREACKAYCEDHNIPWDMISTLQDS